MIQTNSDKKANFTAWLKRVEFLLITRFGINVNDVGWSENEKLRFFNFGETPEDFIDWYRIKYDLDKKPTNY